ncbi:hypothetical protein PMAYCL1PPCAC_10311 [Pristionchus mayeri]|uniref:F-box domain-containing protein n=1 Tax=Pristionchus mayeri TaxID=1317129 RepID=A0AAN5CFJ9_9BILA|nr:hypothetical protein PMAYCL1PPCAC_10311 [Pristionchus mayeri]
MHAQSPFPIEQLPQELVRMIVGYLPWKTNLKLRLVSRQFKQYVDEHLWKPLAYPLLSSLQLLMWKPDEKLPGTAVMTTISVPKKRQIVFRLRLASQMQLAHALEHNLWSNFESYEFNFESMDKHGDLLDHVRNCIGTRVDNLQIQRAESYLMPLPIEDIAKIIEGVRFRQLGLCHVPVNDDDVCFLEQQVFPSLDELWLNNIRMEMTDPSNFLLMISTYVRTVRILVSGVSDMDMSHIEFAELVVKMMSNKTDWLLAHDVHCSALCTPSSINLLREKLPKLGKKIWFQTNNSSGELDYTINEHRVRANDAYFGIKHVTREHEKA